MKTCPKCKVEYECPPAISRDDNKTEICPGCGAQEAYEAFCASRKKAKQVEAKAKLLHKKADALKEAALYEQEFGAGDGSDEVADAWDKYNEAINAANRADSEAKKLQAELDELETKKALKLVTKVKVRDYMLVADIPEQAMRYPADTTFGDLIDIASEIADEENNWRKGTEAAVDWLEEKIEGAIDSDAYEKLVYTLDSIIDRAIEHEIRPLDLL